MLRLSNFLWILLLVGAFLALGSDRAEARTGLASWYGPGFEGLPTASGEPYDPYGYTVAHKTMRLGTELLVSYRGRSVQVTVNDRGPYVAGATSTSRRGLRSTSASPRRRRLRRVQPHGRLRPRYETYPADAGYSNSFGDGELRLG